MSFTQSHLYFDDVAVGQEWESPGRTLTQTDIVNFAGLSGDFNAIHVDHEFARNTPFGQPIAHGLLGLAIGSGLGLNSPPMRTMAFLSMSEWHFREPIFIGDTIRVRVKVAALEPQGRGGRGIVTWQRQIVNQHGKVVQEGVTRTLVLGRAGDKKATEPGPKSAGPSS